MRAGIAWGVHFVISTLWVHAIHRNFTFRNVPKLSYFQSLLRTYIFFFFVLVISTALMIFLCDTNGVHPVLGWALATFFAAMFNFQIMFRWSICCKSKAIAKVLTISERGSEINV